MSVLTAGAPSERVLPAWPPVAPFGTLRGADRTAAAHSELWAISQRCPLQGSDPRGMTETELDPATDLRTPPHPRGAAVERAW